MKLQYRIFFLVEKKKNGLQKKSRINQLKWNGNENKEAEMEIKLVCHKSNTRSYIYLKPNPNKKSKWKKYEREKKMKLTARDSKKIYKKKWIEKDTHKKTEGDKKTM